MNHPIAPPEPEEADLMGRLKKIGWVGVLIVVLASITIVAIPVAIYAIRTH